MRRALVAVGGLLLIGSALPMVAATADDSPGAGLGSFALNAFGTGAQLRVGEPSFCFTSVAAKNGCEGAIPEATSSLQSGPNGSSLASVVWPGDLGANAGSLIVTASGGSAPPQLSMLDSPIRAERHTGQSPDTVTTTDPPGTVMKATAKSTSTSADASVQSTGLPVGSFGPAHATAKTEVTGPQAAVSQVTSSVQDIVLATVVKIGSVQSEALATTNGTKATIKGSTKVTGVTVAGVPVTIDEHGVTVNGTGAGVTALTSQVNTALSQAGLTLRVSEPQGKPDGASVTYTSGALVAVFTPQDGYQFSVTFGQANVTAASVPAIGYVPPSGTTGVFVPSTTGGTTGGSTGAVGTTGGGLVPSGSTGGSVLPPIADPAAGASTGGPAPVTADPVPTASASRLGRHPLGPVSVLLGLLGSGLLLAGMRRLPDRILEALPPVCPLEETS
ncbi:MAG: hypothetical protein JWO12_3582 [Frankiales bacterium]|jgi:hypothetical protein|nr:hypothetical protein [Frankiales bacterium]